jgi:rfaE bifunctional protein nucleotidyltransferase chain/domain
MDHRSGAVMDQPPAVVTVPQLADVREHYRRKGLRVVSTNGCFDLIHAAHVRTLERARRLGDVLVVGLNDDESVRMLKGPTRPLVPQADRANMLASLKCVDHVVVFAGLLPNDWLAILQPDVHCKSADYKADALPEAPVVRQHGGRVEILPLEPGYSTSDLLSRVAAAVEADRQKSPSTPTAAAPAATPAKLGDPVADLIRAMLQSANEHRQLAYRLAPDIVAAAGALAGAARRGGKILLLCDEGSPWIAQAFDLLLRPRLGDALDLCPAGAVTAGPGDVVLAACGGSSVSALAANAITDNSLAAKGVGALDITAILIAPPADEPPPVIGEGARRIVLPVEASDPSAVQILQLVVARAIASLLPRLAAGAQP